ncbi:hypothetical protein vseg_017528 [Gypsophila vaccaria]
MSGNTTLIVKYALPASPVEVVSKVNDQNTLEKFIVKPHERPSFSIPYMDPAIVDFKLLLESEQELKKFESLLSSWGAIQLVNHGIEETILDQVLEVTKEFFQLPLEEKKKHARPRGEEWTFDSIQGWGNDRVGEGHAFSWSDRVILLIHPSTLRNNILWPHQSIPKFREVIDKYLEGLIKVRETLFKALTKMLNLPEDNLMYKYANEGLMVGRFNYYPTAPYPDRILGARPHTDSNLFTILLQDKEVEGLHIEKDEKWYKVPIVPNALVVNTSDMLELLTNGAVRSPVHRAVTDTERERISIAIAMGPPGNSEIGPLKELIDENRPKLYPTLKNSSSWTADFFAQGKILVKEIRKFGPNIVQQQGEHMKN